MLPKSKRLTGKDFNGLRTRIVYRGAFFDVAISPSLSLKYACVIAKKRVKRAVDRNKIKRKILTLISRSGFSGNGYIIMYPTKNALTASYSALSEEIKVAFATL